MIPENSINDPWDKVETIAKEIKAKRQAVDYREIFKERQCIFLGDNHANSSIREHIGHNASNMKAAGVTHFAIEADDNGKPVFDKLCQGEQVDLSNVDVGPAESAARLSKLGEMVRAAASGSALSSDTNDAYAGRAGDEHVIRSVAKVGLHIVPIDMDQSTKPTGEERERHLSDGLLRIYQQYPDAKVAVLIGGFHTLKRYKSEGIETVAQRVANAGYKTASVQFAGGRSDSPMNMTEGARNAGVANEEFIIDLNPYKTSRSVPYGPGEADYVIHLAQIRDPNKDSMNSHSVSRHASRPHIIADFLALAKLVDDPSMKIPKQTKGSDVNPSENS